MLSLKNITRGNVTCQVLLHRKEGRENDQSDHLGVAKLDRLNRMNILIRKD
jgi:hypothetical protein